MLPFHQATSSYNKYMTFKFSNCSFRNAPWESQRMAQTFLVYWKERRDEVVIVEQIWNLSWWKPCLWSHPHTPPGQRFALWSMSHCYWNCHRVNVQLSLRQTGHSWVHTLGWVHVGGAGRYYRAYNDADIVSLSRLIGCGCAYISVAVTEQHMSHKRLLVFG